MIFGWFNRGATDTVESWQREDAYDGEGGEAAVAGIKCEDCPYPAGSTSALYWERGWLNAKSEIAILKAGKVDVSPPIISSTAEHSFEGDYPGLDSSVETWQYPSTKGRKPCPAVRKLSPR